MLESQSIEEAGGGLVLCRVATEKLAEESPEEFDDPETVADASDLLAALGAERWKAETDAAGITKLSHVTDKAPYDSDVDWRLEHHERRPRLGLADRDHVHEVRVS